MIPFWMCAICENQFCSTSSGKNSCQCVFQGREQISSEYFYEGFEYIPLETVFRRGGGDSSTQITIPCLEGITN